MIDQSQYRLLIHEREKIEMKTLKNTEAFIDYSQTIRDAYENLREYNPAKQRKVFIIFDDMIADIKTDKKLNLITL